MKYPGGGSSRGGRERRHVPRVAPARAAVISAVRLADDMVNRCFRNIRNYFDDVFDKISKEEIGTANNADNANESRIADLFALFALFAVKNRASSRCPRSTVAAHTVSRRCQPVPPPTAATCAARPETRPTGQHDGPAPPATLEAVIPGRRQSRQARAIPR